MPREIKKEIAVARQGERENRLESFKKEMDTVGI